MAYTTTNSIQTLAYYRVATQESENLPVLREEVLHSLQAGKSPGVENIPSELLRRRGNTKCPDSDMPDNLGDEGMAEEMDTITRNTFTKQLGCSAK